MGNFSIPLQVQTPQPTSPLTSIGTLMNLRGQMTEIALRNAQIQQAQQSTANVQAEAAQRNRDLADQNHIQEIEKDPDAYSKLLSGDLSPLAGKVQDKTIQAVRTNVNTALQNEAVRTTEQLKQRSDAAKSIGTDMATGLDTQRLPDGTLDVSKVNSLLPSFIQAHAAELKALGIDPSTIPTSVSDEDHFNLLASRVKAFGAMTDAAMGLKKTQTETAEAASHGKQAQATADLDTYRLGLLKGSPQNAVQEKAIIDDLFAGHPDLRSKADAVYAAGKSSEPEKPGAGMAAVKTFYDEQVGKPSVAAATITAETPAKQAQGRSMIPVEAASAAARANAEIAPHVKQAIQTQIEQAKASPDAFGSIINAGARNEVQRDWSKAYGDAATALNQSQQLLDTIAQERAGNKAAASAITVDQARSLIANSRAMALVMHQISTGSGNLIDSIEGKLKGIAGTDRIPTGVIKGIEDLSKVQRDAALRQYDSELVPLQARGADISKLPRPTVVQSNPVGAGKTVSKADVQDYATKHGLSYAAAESHVKTNGFTVQ